MLVAMHQPHYLPWVGYFEKMIRADLFIIVDHVQFERRGWQNRNFIASQGKRVLLTVPVIQNSRDESIINKRINNSCSWRRKHYRSIVFNYNNAPFYHFIKNTIEEIYSQPWELLVDLNIFTINRIRELLGITTPIIRSSTLGKIVGKKTNMIVEICKKVGADSFLSGDGSYYLDVGIFKKNGISLKWQNFKHPHYPQHNNNSVFVSPLSTIDMIMNLGPETKNWILSKE